MGLWAVALLIVNRSPSQAATHVGGPILSDATWTRTNSPYVVTSDLQVGGGVTLTVEPGVTVQFQPGTGMQVRGTLIVQGMAWGVVTFTSSQDSPAAGDWGNIAFAATAVPTAMDADGNYLHGSVLQHCVVEYAGDNAESAIDAHSLLIDHCAVRDNRARGIYNVGTADAPARITYNTVHRNSISERDGAGIYAERATVHHNTVQDNSVYGGFGNGGGIYASHSKVSDNAIVGNLTAGLYGGDGGGIYALDSMVSGNTVVGNASAGFYGRGGGIYASGGVVGDNVVRSNHSVGKYGTAGGIYASGSTVRGNIVHGNWADGFMHGGEGGGIYAAGSTIKDNVVQENAVSASVDGYFAKGGGLYAFDSAVGGNSVRANQATASCAEGGGIYASGSTAITSTLILSNSVSGDACQGAGAYLATSSDFRFNTVVGNGGPLVQNVGGLDISGTPQVHDNNLYGNAPYDVTVLSSDPVSGTQNYWGTLSSADISARIYDGHDEDGRGQFLYVPYLGELSPDAPLLPPTGLAADFQDGAVALSWDAHPHFAAGWGYKIYYDDDSTLPPYLGRGLDEGDSPVDAGEQTYYTLTGLDQRRDFYCAVTVYDDRGRESWYSNVEWRTGSGYWIYLPFVPRSHR